MLSEDQLRIALIEQKRSGEQLGKTLVKLGFLSEATLREALSENLGQGDIDVARVVADPAALAMVPKSFAVRFSVLPVALDRARGVLTVAVGNPNNVVVLDQLNAMLRGEMAVEARISSEAEVTQAIDKFYGHELSIDGILNEIETGVVDYESLTGTDGGYTQPIVRLIDALVGDAVSRRASDIHFEPEQGFVRIRYRIDGVLRQIRALHSKYWSAMLVRLKVMSGMNIAESRAPQDGRISLHLQGRYIDFRVAAQPTTHGENVVLRILDKVQSLVALDALGLAADQFEALQLMITRPDGILLVTGPTGSGKTTTLYSILSALNTEGVNIMTLEDPVEYPLPMIRQTSLAEGLKIDFASGIRSMMRQDPDIILVGEIRDADTATMALRAAMTGHQVFSTLHTNSALGALARLTDLGLNPEILAGNMIGVIAQRLVRRLCRSCKRPYQPNAAQRRLLGLDGGSTQPLYEAMGCADCEQQGYLGRIALMEVVRFDSELDELVARRATLRELRAAVAAQSGALTLAQDAIRRVLDGTTTISEIARTIDLTSIEAH
ncbi:MAG TPA: GspE/PulE family protein [Steroidobacteraceae bacterium]|nr:GspE/PulE family protein [Steroidobacteraceae bacterium]